MVTAVLARMILFVNYWLIEDFVSVFPNFNIHLIINTMQKSLTQGFSFEVVLSCHEKWDLVGLIAELLEKFAGSHKFINRVKSLCKLPEKTLKPYATLAYCWTQQWQIFSH